MHGMTPLAADGTLLCSVTPAGNIRLTQGASDEANTLSPATMAAIAGAFSHGTAQGILDLALFHLDEALPPALQFWRELGKRFVSQTCATLDAASDRPPAPDASELAELVAAVPYMTGADQVTPELLLRIWHDLGTVLSNAAESYGGVGQFLASESPVWHVVGRVCLHLAENKRDPARPFAFLATYAHRLSDNQKPRHLPLSRALKEFRDDAATLRTLLTPLLRAAESSPLLRGLIDSRDVYHPLAWTAPQAHRFLTEVELYRNAGLAARVPDWWNAKRRPRPRVSVTVGNDNPSSLGVEALLDFDVSITLDGERLTASETKALLAETDGLVLIKGKWVEADNEAISALLSRWDEATELQREGLPFAQAMRMLAGLSEPSVEGEDPLVDPDWSEVVAGPWLRQRLDALVRPQVQEEVDRNAGLDAQLRPYQKTGAQWLWTLRQLGLGACLADDMGLGKTIQVLAVLSMAKGRNESGTDLLVVPASLLSNWHAEFERFAPHLKVLVAHSSAMPVADVRALGPESVGPFDAVITTYGTVLRSDWMKAHGWRAIVLDEAQAIKNPSAKQTKAVKSLSSRWRLALTGTPVENRLGDLWSLFDFINPGLLGSARAFTRLSKAMAQSGGGVAPLRRVTRPYILRRLKTDKNVISDLPDKTEVTAWCRLSKRQAALYEQAVDEMKQRLEDAAGIERRGIVLSFLMRFKQICNHPSQWLGDGAYAVADSGKFGRLVEIAETIAARQDKMLIFTQFRTLCDPLGALLAEVFGTPGLVLHGGTPVKKRQSLVERFQADEQAPFMVLSLKAGGVGLNLTAASHVIHFDRWWNPAVENQATDRAFRIGQKRNVLVHKFACVGTLEGRIDALIQHKQLLSDEILDAGAETRLTELSNDELISMVTLDLEQTMAREPWAGS